MLHNLGEDYFKSNPTKYSYIFSIQQRECLLILILTEQTVFSNDIYMGYSNSLRIK